MKLEAKNLLKEKLVALKKIMADAFIDEYNSKVCTRNFKTLKFITEQYKNVIDDIDDLIVKYCSDLIDTLWKRSNKNGISKFGL